MVTAGEYSLGEITSQGESWQGALDAVRESSDVLRALSAANAEREHLFIGCGSTHYLAQCVAPFYQSVTGRRSRGVPSSELLFQTDALVVGDEKPLVIALSRSGKTSETIMAARKMREAGSNVLTISCYDDTGLSSISDLTICIPEGREESFAQTRSFAGMLIAAQAFAALTAGDGSLLSDLERLPDLADDIIARAKPLAQSFGTNEDLKRITYLGSGPLYGLASEATVKMKEMSLSLAEPYHFMEFRHGPMSLVDEEHLVVALLSDRTRDYELGVLQDLVERGARVLVIGCNVADLGGAFDGVFDLGATVSEHARLVLYLPFVQLMAYYRAMGRGLNPDRPRNVVMAITLDGARIRS